MSDPEMHAFEERLENWAWVMRYGHSNGHCASAEHMYRPPRRGEERRQPDRQADAADGWSIEAAWKQLPEKQRWLLKFHFVHSMSRSGVIRWVAKRGHIIKPWNFPAELLHAMRALKKIVDMTSKSTENSSQQFESLFQAKSV